MKINRLALRRAAARELGAECSLRAEVELAPGDREDPIIRRVVLLVRGAARVSSADELDSGVLIAIFPTDHPDKLVARRRIDGHVDLAIRRDGLIEEDCARHDRDAIHRGEDGASGADVVGFLVLIAIAEAIRTARQLHDVACGQHGEAECASEGRREGVCVLAVSRNRGRDLVVFVSVEVGSYCQRSGTRSDLEVVVITLGAKTLAGSGENDVSVEAVEPAGLTCRDADAVGERRGIARGNDLFRMRRVRGLSSHKHFSELLIHPAPGSGRDPAAPPHHFHAYIDMRVPS